MEKKPRDPAEAKGSGTAKTVPPRVSSGFEADPLHTGAAPRQKLSLPLSASQQRMRVVPAKSDMPNQRTNRNGKTLRQGNLMRSVTAGRRGRTSSSPGKSGNRSGRPKGAKNHKSLLFEQLNRTISIHQGGKTEKCTIREALLRRCIDMALKGDLKALMFLLNNDEKSAIAHAAKEVRLIRGDESPQEAAAIFAAMLNED